MERKRGTQSLPGRIAVMALTTILLLSRAWLPYRSLDATGLIALRDLTLTLLHWMIFTLLCWGLGSTIFDWIVSFRSSPIRNFFTESALGLGVVSYLVLALGLAQLLNPVSLAVLQISLAFVIAPKLIHSVKQINPSLMRSKSQLRAFSWPIRWIIGVSVVIGSLSFLNSLGPLWDYDGLMYHVLGPRIFLEHGGIFPQVDNWYINGPFTIELLFTFGLPYGDEVFAKLIHFSYGVLFVGAAWQVARYFVSDKLAWMATGILLTVPTLPVWASFAYIDLGWSAYEVLALLAFLSWWKTRADGTLILSGVFTGFAVGSKYLGMFGAALLFLLLVYVLYRERPSTGYRLVALFCLPIILLAAPWLAKNWIWLGNPVYPMFFGGEGWSAQRLELYTSYLQSFGVGRELKDFLALPWNVYAHHTRFGGVMNRIDIPSVLFPFSLLILYKSNMDRLKALMVFALLRWVVWSLGSQQVRFLIPIYPILGVSASVVFDELGSRMRRAWQDFPTLLVGGLMLITLFYQVRIFVQFSPPRAFLGLESEDHYLSRIVKDYQVINTIRPSLSTGQKILLLGDGRGYYCYPDCLADPDHFRWAYEINAIQSSADFATWLDMNDVEFILLSIENLDFFFQHDPKQEMSRAIEKIQSEMASGCLEKFFSDEWTVVLTYGCR